MKTLHPSRKALHLLRTGILVVGSAFASLALGQTWTNIGSAGSWTNPSIWTANDSYPNARYVTAFFDADLASPVVITNENMAITAGTLVFTTPGEQGFTIRGTGAATNVLDNTGGSGAVAISVTAASAATNQILTPVVVANTFYLTNQGNLIFGAPVVNPYALAVSGGGHTYFQQGLHGAGSVTLTSGASNGFLAIEGTSTYAGNTIVEGGVLRANDGGGLSTNGNLSIKGGGVLEGLGVASFTRALGAGGNQVNLNDPGGFSAHDGKLTVNLGGSGATLVWASTPNFLRAGTELIFGSTNTADSEVEFQNGLDLNNAQRTIIVRNNPAANGDFARISGLVTNGSLLKAGAGLLVLDNAFLAQGTSLFKPGENAGTLLVKGGLVTALGLQLGDSGSEQNVFVISGSGTVFSNSTGATYVGYQGNASRNQFIVSNDARAYALNAGGDAFVLGNVAGNASNLVVVDHATLNINGRTKLGANGASKWNQLLVTNGGRVLASFSGSGVGFSVGVSSGANSNRIVVTGPGSQLDVAAAANGFYVGQSADWNELLIRDGGQVIAGNNSVYAGAGSTRSNAIVVTRGGVLEANSLTVASGDGNFISNVGGTYRFTTATPSLAPNGFGRISLTDGTISFRAVADAPVTVIGGFLGNKIAFLGDNSFELNAATNAALTSYTLATGVSSNFMRLILTGTNAFWRSAALTVGNGGELLATNSVGAALGAVLTNAGTIRVVNGSLTYLSNVVNQGAYISDPSTNAFNGNFTVGPTATVVAAAGDVYAFGGNLVMQSTNRAFDMHLANAVFADSGYGLTAGGTNHTFDLTGSGALDKGSNWLDVAQLATNFSIGTLSIASGNRLTVTGDAGTNALYVGTLDLSAWDTDASSLTNTLQAALNLPNVNLYYDMNLAANSYLAGNTFDLWGGQGLLIPIPEPGALTLILAAGALALLGHRRKTRWE